MDDLISRRKAIDRINKQREHLQPDIYPQDKIGDTAYRICAEFIARLPSAQPDLSEYSDKLWKSAYERGKAEEQDARWVSCSDRLPEEGQKCLVCDKGSIGIDTYIGHGNPYNWKWYTRDYEAWMPLPEPYRGGGE